MLQATRIYTAAPIGSYVMYKNTPYIVVDFNDDMTMVKILNALEGNAKLNVKSSNTYMINCTDATCVELQGVKYLVTARGCIISLQTNRVVWVKDCAHRAALLTA